jgi:hypothetical protein
MIKASKITIKCFLKKSLPSGSDENGNLLYPLYIMITYKRKNTQIKSHYGLVYAEIQEVNEYDPGLIDFEEKIVRKIVENEIGRVGEDYFTLVGLGQKYDIYSTSIYWAIEKYIKEKLWKAIQKTNDELQMVLQYHSAHATFTRLYKAATLLFKDFNEKLSPELAQEVKAYQTYLQLFPERPYSYNFPTIIEWVNGDFRRTLAEAYHYTFKRDERGLKAIFNLIENASQKILEKLD